MSTNSFYIVKSALESLLLGNRNNGMEQLLQHLNKVARFMVFAYSLPEQDKDDLVQFMFEKKVLNLERSPKLNLRLASEPQEEVLEHATASVLASLRYVPLEYRRSEHKHYHDLFEESQTEFEAIEKFREDGVQRKLSSLFDEVRAQLSDEDQQTYDALLSHVDQRFSYEELGNTLGVNPKTLRSRVRRLLPKLRKMLQEMV